MVPRARLSSLTSSSFLLRLALASAPGSAAVAPLVAMGLLLAPTPAAAQPAVGDADRAAARDLFVDGVKLQDAGKYKDALDRLQRAQSVLNAPTHLLHIAECQAALGHLIEAAEAYRLLARAQLAPSAPKPFLAAQQQGASELAQIEPRIPSLKLVVKPENVSGLTVQIDGQPVSAALVGVARPSNPGEHTFAVSAPGYTPREQRATVREREQKEVVVSLEASGEPLPVAAPPPVATTPLATAPADGAPPAPAEYQANQAPPGATPASPRRGNTWSFLVGPRVGLALGVGSLSTSGGGNNASTISDLASPGLDVGVEAGFRFARVLYGGLVFDHGAYGKGSAINDFASGTRGSANFTSKTYSNYFGATFAYISHPEGVGFYGEIGLGYRWLNADVQFQETGGATGAEDALQQWRGGEATLGVGVHIKVGDYFRLVPKWTASLGSFSESDVSCATNGPASCAETGLPGTATGTSVISQDPTQSSFHAFFAFTVMGVFDIGRHEPAE